MHKHISDSFFYNMAFGDSHSLVAIVVLDGLLIWPPTIPTSWHSFPCVIPIPWVWGRSICYILLARIMELLDCERLISIWLTDSSFLDFVKQPASEKSLALAGFFITIFSNHIDITQPWLIPNHKMNVTIIYTLSVIPSKYNANIINWQIILLVFLL